MFSIDISTPCMYVCMYVDLTCIHTYVRQDMLIAYGLKNKKARALRPFGVYYALHCSIQLKYAPHTHDRLHLTRRFIASSRLHGVMVYLDYRARCTSLPLVDGEVGDMPQTNRRPRRPPGVVNFLNLSKANGCVYQGNFRRGVRHGYGTCTFPGGERYTGNWEKGKMHGEGTLDIKGRTLTGIWEQGCVMSLTANLVKSRRSTLVSPPCAF